MLNQQNVLGLFFAWQTNIPSIFDYAIETCDMKGLCKFLVHLDIRKCYASFISNTIHLQHNKHTHQAKHGGCEETPTERVTEKKIDKQPER